VRTSRLQAAADLATRVVAVLTVAGLAGLAATISYQHMVLLARRHGVSGIDAHAFPICVDGLDLIGVLVLLSDRRSGRPSGRLPWIVLTVGTVASIAANVAVAPNNTIARAISGWSAIALLAAAKMLGHLFEPATTPEPGPSRPGDSRTATPPAAAAPPGPVAAPPAPNAPAAAPPREDTTPPRPGRAGDVARRIPTSPDAYARWRAVWEATRHLPAATRETARAHGVSLRTLQFIRAAGQAGHLAGPAQTPPASAADKPPNVVPTAPKPTATEPAVAEPSEAERAGDPAGPDRPEPSSAGVLTGQPT
jgi:hypothetical protein